MTKKHIKFSFDRTDFSETEDKYKLRRAGEREGIAITRIKVLAPKPTSKPRAKIKKCCRGRKRAIRENAVQTALEQRGSALGSLQSFVRELVGDDDYDITHRVNGREIRDIGQLTVDELFLNF